MIQYKYITKQNKEIWSKNKKLWIDIFGDTPEYLDLLYSDSGDHIVLVATIGMEVIATMTALKYKIGDSRYGAYAGAWYLCGLATDTKYRKKGIMSHMLDLIDKRAAEEGTELLMLIPAGKSLAQYYSSLGYMPMQSLDDFSLRYKLPDTASAAFSKSRLLVADLCSIRESEILNRFTEWLEIMDCQKQGLCLRHSAEDFRKIIADFANSGNKVIFTYRGSLSEPQIEVCFFMEKIGDTAVVREILGGKDMEKLYGLQTAVLMGLVPQEVKIATNTGSSLNDFLSRLSLKTWQAEENPIKDLEVQYIGRRGYGMVKKTGQVGDRNKRKTEKVDICENRIFSPSRPWLVKFSNLCNTETYGNFEILPSDISLSLMMD